MAAMVPQFDAAEDQLLFVLVTGTNSGIGLGICFRLIDEFLQQYPSPARLVLLVTTRSPSKSRATIQALQQHLNTICTAASSSHHNNLNHNEKLAAPRILLASVEVDLCHIPGVYDAAEKLLHGTVPLYGYDPASPALVVEAKIPRLDAIILNAGIGGWTGLKWGALLRDVVTAGIIQATTYPTCKKATPGLLVDTVTGKDVDVDVAGADTVMGKVFCANVFGHYVFSHKLVPLLQRRTVATKNIPPGRIIWESSVEAVCWKYFTLDDFQAVRTEAAYESSKRLIDILALTARLPGVRPVSEPFFVETEEETDQEKGPDASLPATPPSCYVTHPGVVCSTLFPLSALLFFFYNLGMYVSRWIGSPWHPVTAYNGACAAVWLALQPQAALDSLQASNSKWGAASKRCGQAVVKKTEVEGWGWQGRPERPEDDPTKGILAKTVGRRKGTIDTTDEQRQEFEALGRDCWREMERLRTNWEMTMAAMKKGKAA